MSHYKNSLDARMNVKNWQQNIVVASVGTSYEELKNWAANYNFMSTAAQLWMASSDETNDVGLEITIEGLVEETIDGVVYWLEDGEDLALDGTDARTPVETVKTYIRINKVSVKGTTPLTGILSLADEDSGTWSAGAPGTASNTVGYIAAGEKESNMMIFSVPSNHNGKILEAHAHGGLQAGDISIQANRFNGFGFVELDKISFQMQDHDYHVYEAPLRVYPKSDLKVLGIADTATTEITARIGMALH